MTYLDYNASAPMPDVVVDAIAAAARITGNPSSVHAYGRQARAVVEDARGAVAAAVGARPEQVVFTSGATEANALALRCCGRRRVLVSAAEHVSVLNAVSGMEPIPVDSAGIVDLAALRTLLGGNGKDAVVAVMLANNETGVIQPVEAVAAIAAEKGALLLCDGVQGPGRIPVDFAALGVDFLSLSAHKLGGPKGVGALILRREGSIAAGTLGGGQERGLRGGTENLTGNAGFGAAARAVPTDLSRAGAIERLRDGLEARVHGVAPDSVVFGADARRLPNTACIALPGVSAEAQVMALDLAGVAVSAGSACSSGKIKASHVLRAMGVPDGLARCAIRVSLGPGTGAADIEAFIGAWSKLAARSRQSAA
jgi:cysteine desulfurase